MNEDNTAMYNSEEVERTLSDSFMTDALRVSRSIEIEFLQKELAKLYDFFKEPLRVFDIGVGDGHVLVNLQKELLDKIESYIGIDNSSKELEYFKKNIEGLGLGNKVKAFELDAANLDDISFQQKLSLPFHVVVSTYFTAGNFKPNQIKLAEDGFGRIKPYPTDALSPNKKFQKIFSEAYKLLCDGGKIILGSVYIDSSATRLKQEEFYKKCGMDIITTERDEFTATRQGFWSERFTNEKIYSYLDWIDRKSIKFLPLDNEQFSQMIVVTKK